MISTTHHRVTSQTDPQINANIHRRTEQNVAYFAAHPEEIDWRLSELDREWDIDRTLETMSSGITLFGFAMSLLRSRRWLVIPLVVQSFFLQHALQGWAPPLGVLRKLGFRTMEEIDKERYALKALRGDFKDVQAIPESGAAQEARDLMACINR